MHAWRIPLSAHVCTTVDAPAINIAGIFLETAPELHAKAEVLLAKYRVLKDGTYREALWDGWYALKKEADECLKHAISCGALLHYDCPRALAVAKAARKLRTQRLRLEAEVPTC